MYATVDYDDGDVTLAEPPYGLKELRREMTAEICCRPAEDEHRCMYGDY